jgi:hypothetical protein
MSGIETLLVDQPEVRRQDAIDRADVSARKARTEFGEISDKGADLGPSAKNR